MAFPLRNYARALYEAAAGKTKAEVGELVERTLGVMREKGALSKADVLMAEVERIDDQANGRLRARIDSAHRLDDSILDKLEKMLRQRTGAKEIIWDKHVDKALLGGIVIAYGDTILDMSLKQSVASLAEQITN